MSRRSTGILAVVVTSVLWGTTGTAATFAPAASPLAIGSAALGIGGLLQFAVAWRAVAGNRMPLARHRGVIIVAGMSVAVYPLAFYASMHLAGVAIGSVVSLASAPLFSGALEALIDRRRPDARWILSVVLAVGGGTALILSRAGGSGSGVVVGVVLGLVAGATYAVYSWAAHRLMDAGIPRSAAMGAIFGLGGILLMPVLTLTGAPLIASAQAFTVAAYMALVPMFLGYLLFGFGLARIAASTATTVTLLEPAVATLLAVVVVGERPTTAGWIGMAAIAASLLVLSLPAKEGDPGDRSAPMP
ncbi:DMT family transporter [Microbacterium sp.]|uniref:DMT family transporter n=1 Tax=Microbacterium sp. TaxID=51671 RepID=UPI003A942EA7